MNNTMSLSSQYLNAAIVLLLYLASYKNDSDDRLLLVENWHRRG
jgi:hypothetical protein